MTHELKSGAVKKASLTGALVPLFVLLAVNAVVLYHLAFRIFFFVDFNAFLDASWRVMHGQRPYVDFYYTTGPLHLFVNAFFFLLFGFGKTAIYAQIVLFSSIAMVLTFFTAWKRVPIMWILPAVFVAGAGPYWGFPHPWYDMTAHLWGIIAAAAIMAWTPFEDNKTAVRTGFLCGVMALLALLTKSNIGGGYGLAFFAVLLAGPRRWPALQGYIAGVLVALVICFIIMIPDPAAFYENVVLYSSNRSRQILRFLFIPVWLKNLYWLPFLAVWFATAPFRGRVRQQLFLFIGIGAVGLFALNTGSLRRWDHLPAFGMYLAVALVLLYRIRGWCETRWQKSVRIIALVLVIGTAFFQSYRCIEIAAIIHDFSHPLNPQGHYALKSKPLDGWLMYQRQGETLDNITAYIRENIPRDESLLIFCEPVLAYALSGRDSYRGVPFIWPIKGTTNVEGARPGATRDYVLAHPPDWMLIKNSPGSSQNFLTMLKAFDFPPDFPKSYALVKTWGEYGMLRRMPNGS